MTETRDTILLQTNKLLTNQDLVSHEDLEKSILIGWPIQVGLILLLIKNYFNKKCLIEPYSIKMELH